MHDFKEFHVLVLEEKNMSGKSLGAQAINVDENQHNTISWIMGGKSY